VKEQKQTDRPISGRFPRLCNAMVWNPLHPATSPSRSFRILPLTLRDAIVSIIF